MRSNFPRVRQGAPLLLLGLVLVAAVALPALAADPASIAAPATALDYLDAIVKSVLGFVLTGLVAWIGRHVRDARIRAALDMALGRAAGLVADFLHSEEAAALDAATRRSTGVALGVAYMNTRLAPQLARMGWTPDLVAQSVTAETVRAFGPIFNADPAPPELGADAGGGPMLAVVPAVAVAPPGGALAAARGAVGHMLGLVAALGLALGLAACAAAPGAAPSVPPLVAIDAAYTLAATAAADYAEGMFGAPDAAIVARLKAADARIYADGIVPLRAAIAAGQSPGAAAAAVLAAGLDDMAGAIAVAPGIAPANKAAIAAAVQLAAAVLPELVGR